MEREGAEHQPGVLFTKENMDADKPIPVVNIPPVSFIGGPTSQGITQALTEQIGRASCQRLLLKR